MNSVQAIKSAAENTANAINSAKDLADATGKHANKVYNQAKSTVNDVKNLADITERHANNIHSTVSSSIQNVADTSTEHAKKVQESYGNLENTGVLL